MRTEVAGIVLAAGAGRRFGMPKALVEHRGSLLVDRALAVLADGGCAPVAVVLGASADEVLDRAQLPGAVIVHNRLWPSGMGSSLRAGLDRLAETSCAAAVVLPVDMPGVTSAAVRRLRAHAGPDSLAAASYAGMRGHPVLLGARHWPGVRAAATGDAGARGYLREREVTLVGCDDVSEGFDVDQPGDLDEVTP
ncbi:nucleotidyltransferase family protein [Saccharopolyspora sp. HNM0983]|uniref:Nucleotidyltransferase family protein n=1 Tax=Saccharopolyspora montiporae TaxID=2781240 RepID=A0A929BD14_9PSEU|nr:nucleotidyltransferase family protein [Saccharopolyspora sp. HNM0983]